jgi:hypothetical protein
MFIFVVARIDFVSVVSCCVAKVGLESLNIVLENKKMIERIRGDLNMNEKQGKIMGA